MSLGMLISVLGGGSSGGSTPPDPPADEYNAPVSGDITFTDDDFQASIPGYAKTGGWTGRSAMGFVDFRTEETDFQVKVASDWVGHGNESKCAMYVDGVLQSGLTVTVSNTIQNISISGLSAGMKEIRLVNGYAAEGHLTDPLLPKEVVCIQGVITTGDIEIKVPPVNEVENLVLTDSIGTGASSTLPPAKGWVGLLREAGWFMRLDSWGGRLIETSNDTLATNLANRLISQMNGTVLNNLIITLGTNNFGLQNYAAVYFLDYMFRLIDKVHTLAPTIKIYSVSPLIRTSYNTPNTSGSTLQDYHDGLVAGQASRSWLTVIDGKTWCSLSNMPDGVHPNDTGHVEIYTQALIDIPQT